jgi:hypothetical protein
MTLTIQIAFGVLGGYWLIRLVPYLLIRLDNLFESWRTRRVIKPGAGLWLLMAFALLVFGIFAVLIGLSLSW